MSRDSIGSLDSCLSDYADPDPECFARKRKATPIGEKDDLLSNAPQVENKLLLSHRVRRRCFSLGSPMLYDDADAESERPSSIPPPIEGGKERNTGGDVSVTPAPAVALPPRSVCTALENDR